MMYADRRWWEPGSKGEAHERLWAAWTDLRAADAPRQQAHLRWARLYGNKNFQALDPSKYTRANSDNRLKLNLVRVLTNKIHARVSQQRPRPWPVSTGGNYSVRRRARLLGRYLDAQLRISHAYELGARIVKDAIVMSAGVIKVWEDGEQVRLERTLARELFVDPVEAYYGSPRTLYQQRWVSKDVLAALYPKARAIVEEADRTESTDGYAADLARDVRSDQVLAVEAWHLPSGPGAKDGRHVVALASGILHSEEWEHDYFPFVILRWDEPLDGFWSDSVPDMVQGVQTEINAYLQSIQSSHHLFGKPFIFTEGAKAASEQTFTNKIGSFIEVQGERWDIKLFQTLSPEIYQQLESYWSRGHELVGLTQSGGESVPKGLPESGVGLRTLNDMNQVPHLPFAKRYEQLFIDLGSQIIDRARDIASRKGGNYAVPAARDKNTLHSVKWSEVDMKRDQYFMQVFPTSSLPAEPTGRLAHVESLTRAQLIDPRQGRMLLDFPDLESETTLDRAVTESIDRAVELMLDEGQRLQPSPYMDLQATLKRVQAHVLVAECEGVPEERIDLLRGYLDGVHELMRRAQEEQMRISMAAASGTQAPPAGAGAAPAPGPTGQAPGAIV